jgi:hypothetical protein
MILYEGSGAASLVSSDPPDPRPSPPGVGQPSSILRPAGLAEPSNARRFLQRAMPDSWRFAHQMALDMVRQTEFLSWPGRADAFDTYFLRQAEAMLRPTGLTELVNGATELADSGTRRDLEKRAGRFASWSRATVTAVLLDLREGPDVAGPLQALTYLIGRDLALARAAAAWTARHGMEPIGDVLRHLPGYALVLLASSPNDTAERFLARDAFWTAVMKSG